MGIQNILSRMTPGDPAHVVPHPHYPLGVQIAGYVENTRGTVELLSIFAVICAALLGGAYVITKRFKPRISNSEVAQVSWFVLSGSIHLFFEGYYSVNQARLGTLNTLFGQAWKEYAMSDSRYLTQDAFVLCMETTTAFAWGPLCFVVAYMIAVNHPYRHPLSALVCTGQMYGDVLYYATGLFDHYALQMTYTRPEAFYFWVYFVLMNAFWMLFPGMILYDNFVSTAQAFRVAQRTQGGKKIN